VVNFENTVIVMTSNAGSDRRDGTVGFGMTASQQNKEKALKALSDFLRPEFINRVDEIISFNRLSEEDFRGIAKIMLGELKSNLEERGIALRWEDSILDYLVKKSYSITYGARNLRRTVQKELEDPMAQRIIDSYDHPVTQIRAAAENGAVRIDAL
jgi:ATP-dependent Clp protease ATP-binding subunit ClpA